MSLEGGLPECDPDVLFELFTNPWISGESVAKLDGVTAEF
jgi:hypothetical protein